MKCKTCDNYLKELDTCKFCQYEKKREIITFKNKRYEVLDALGMNPTDVRLYLRRIE